jgi:hypothetical protein
MLVLRELVAQQSELSHVFASVTGIIGVLSKYNSERT